MEEVMEVKVPLNLSDVSNKEKLAIYLTNKSLVGKQIKLVFKTDDAFSESDAKDIADIVKYIAREYNINPSKITTYIDIKYRNYFELGEIGQLKTMSEDLKKLGTKSYIYSTVKGAGEDSKNSPEWEIDKIIDTNIEIDTMVNFCKEKKLSPLETLLYYYITVTSKKYQEVAEGENNNLSRHVFSVILGDKIVCVGYAEWLELLVKSTKNSNLCATDISVCAKEKDEELNINETNHQAVLGYIKDKKYGIEGYSYIESTWESSLKKYGSASLVYFMVPFMDMMQNKELLSFVSNPEILTSIRDIELQKQTVKLKDNGKPTFNVEGTDLESIINIENYREYCKQQIKSQIKYCQRKDFYVTPKLIDEMLDNPMQMRTIFFDDGFRSLEETEKYTILVSEFFSSLTDKDIEFLVDRAVYLRKKEGIDLYGDCIDLLNHNNRLNALPELSKIGVICSYETIERALSNVLYKMGMTKSQISEYLDESRKRNIENFEEYFNKEECSSSLAGYELPKSKEKVI